MISLGAHRAMIVLVLVLVCSIGWGGEPNEPPIQLTFEVSSTALGPFSPSRRVAGYPEMWQLFASRKPAYAAAIPVAGPTEFLPFTGHGSSNPFSSDKPRAGLSERQKAFLDANGWFFQRPSPQMPNPLLRGRREPTEPEHVWLYAMTREDAQKMAQAYYQYARDQFRYALAMGSQGVQETTERIARDEKRMSELEKLTEATQKSLADLVKIVPYRLESEAQEVIGELDRMLYAAQVESAGIKAKVEAIHVYHTRPLSKGEVRVTSSETTAKLDMMLVEESIALRGAEARRQTAMHLREQTNRFLDLKSTVASAAAEKETLAGSLEKHRKDLAMRQHNLESLPQWEPKIPEKVVIYPVQWVD